MRYIIRFFVVCLVVTILFLAGKVKAITAQFVEKEYVAGAYVVKNDGVNRRYEQIRFIRNKANNFPVYCLEPFKSLSSNTLYNGYLQNPIDLNISNEVLEKAIAIAFYGYGYAGKVDAKWYAITQVMIWRLTSNADIYFTETLNGKRNDNLFKEEITHLESLVTNHYVKPDFGTKKVSLKLGEKITLPDLNGVLENYTIKSQHQNLDIQKEGNNLIVTALNSGTDKLKLSKSISMYSTVIIYTHPTDQDILSGGNFRPLDLELEFEITGGSIEMQKIDSETLLNTGQENTSLKNAVYELFDEQNNLLDTLTTNSKGYAKGNILLPVGNYYLMEKSASYGYELDENKYHFSITFENPDVSLTLKEKIIKKKIIIQKILATDKTGIVTPEEGIIFEFESLISGKVISAETDKNGYLTVQLPYGEYLVRQITSYDGYEKTDNFNIIIDENSDNEIFKTIANKKIPEEKVTVEIPNTGKNSIMILVIILLVIILLIVFKYLKKYKATKLLGIFILLSLSTAFLLLNQVRQNISYALEDISVSKYINEYFYSNNPNDEKTVLEIEKINLKKYLPKFGSFDNHVDRNIQIIKLDNNDFSRGNIILAAHSGNGSHTYFKDLDKLKLGDKIHIYSHGNKYYFKIVSIDVVDKVGEISVLKNESTATLSLTTCHKTDNTKQLIINAFLVTELTTNN